MSRELGLQLVLVLLFLTGCAADTRQKQSESVLLAERAKYFERLAIQNGAPQKALVERVAEKQRAFQMGRLANPPTLEVLILSGGGDYGAFGAGFLKGWGTVDRGPWARPTFDAVTGVSTGALIAPFAFVGDEAAYARVDHLYRNPKPDWIRERSLLAFLLTGAPFFEVSGLDREIREAAGPDLIRQIAAGAREGRVMAVGATNIDYGQQTAFVLSHMAIDAEASGDPSRVQDAMLASSAIPIAFPPREIAGSLYVDGGLTSNILFSGDPESPTGFSATWRSLYPDLSMPRIRYWVIVNNQMVGPPDIVQPRWTSVGGSSVATAIRASTAASLRELSLLVRIQRAAGIDSEMHWVCIPDEWRPPVEGMFKPETMCDLADLGQRMGSEPASWRTDVNP